MALKREFRFAEKASTIFREFKENTRKNLVKSPSFVKFVQIYPYQKYANIFYNVQTYEHEYVSVTKKSISMSQNPWQNDDKMDAWTQWNVTKWRMKYIIMTISHYDNKSLWQSLSINARRDEASHAPLGVRAMARPRGAPLESRT